MRKDNRIARIELTARSAAEGEPDLIDLFVDRVLRGSDDFSGRLALLNDEEKARAEEVLELSVKAFATYVAFVLDPDRAPVLELFARVPANKQ